MGQQDYSTKDYISDADIFADAVNYYLYGGEQVVDPRMLKPLDSVLLLNMFREGWDSMENDPRVKKNRRKSKFIHRFRDAVRKTSVMTDDQCAYVIIGIEAQTKTHYAMAVRNIIYDGLQYAQQVDDLQVGHRINGDVESSEEFLSGMHREDRLIPVITICLYFGTEPWDGALSLMELFDLPDERLLPYIQDYKVFLMEPSRMSDEDFGKFSTNLGQVLKFMKVAQDKKKLAELVNSDDAFKKLDRKAAQVIRDCAKVEINIEPEQEEVNMCKGWYDAIEDARKEEREAAQEREAELCKGWYDAIEDARKEEREAAQEREAELCKGWYDAIEDARKEEREAAQEREAELCKGWYDAMEDARKEEREAAQEREEELRAAANTMAIYSVVEAYKDIKMPSEDIRSWIMKKYDLTETDADRYLAFASA